MNPITEPVKNNISGFPTGFKNKFICANILPFVYEKLYTYYERNVSLDMITLEKL